MMRVVADFAKYLANVPTSSAATNFALLFLEGSIVVRFRLSDAPPRNHSPCDHQLKPKGTDSNRNLANDQDRRMHKQTP
jgi:hypothetical protein